MIPLGWEPTPPRPGSLDDHPCHIPNCGNSRCGTCDERMLCTGPEPAEYPCATHIDECRSCNDDHRCPECQVERMKARAEQLWAHVPDDALPPWEPGQEWADHWGEQRKEDRAYEAAQLQAREEDARW